MRSALGSYAAVELSGIGAFVRPRIIGRSLFSLSILDLDEERCARRQFRGQGRRRLAASQVVLPKTRDTARSQNLFLVRTNSFRPPGHLRQRFRDPPGSTQIQIPEPRDFVYVSLVCILRILSIPRLKLNNLPKRSGMEKLLPCLKYLLKRPHRICVHLIGDLQKALIEVPDGTRWSLSIQSLLRVRIDAQSSLRVLELPSPNDSVSEMLSWFDA